ncbi:MAG: glycosyltransferase [Acidobacteria bacterium]|nr:glycosyltransferase [Acidobacteriota bacterium]
MIIERPTVSFEHLHALSGPLGTFEHCEGREPRVEHGYCTDDVARVLLACLREPQPDSEVLDLASRSLDFLHGAQDARGRFVNRRQTTGQWMGRATNEDCWGRAVWALGLASVRGRDEQERDRARTMFDLSAPVGSPWPRSLAFAVLGAHEGSGVLDDSSTSRLMFDAHEVLVRPELDPDWYWPESSLTYANAVLPDALLVLGLYFDDDELIDRALGQLQWLLAMESRRGYLSVTPAGGRRWNEPSARFDQQSIEVATLVEACSRALGVTGDERWRRGVELGVDWFLGLNDGRCRMYDPDTGGGYDGLTSLGPNTNQGAESTLAYITTFQHARRWSGVPA